MKTKGNWVVKTSAGGYWCGNAHFDHQLRKAQIYHWKEAAEEMIDTLRRRKYITDASITLEVLEVIPPQERKDTEAEWLSNLADECGIAHVSYVCSVCGYSALNDYRGNSVASKFCPRCGKYMTNHQQEDDE
jgi:rubrerythrin